MKKFENFYNGYAISTQFLYTTGTGITGTGIFFTTVTGTGTGTGIFVTTGTGTGTGTGIFLKSCNSTRNALGILPIHFWHRDRTSRFVREWRIFLKGNRDFVPKDANRQLIRYPYLLINRL